ncbi:hypothetical protein ACHAXT_011907 [Thalassiosira profunda]
MLTPSLSPLGRHRWMPFVEDDALSCYSYLLPHRASAAADNINCNEAPAFAASQLDAWFRALHPSAFANEPSNSAWTDASYKGKLLLRKTAWHTFGDRCTCEYGYSDTWQPLIASARMKEILREITDAVSHVCGLDSNELNSVNLNYYPQGGGVGLHADDEILFDGLNRETRIVSLSLCARAPCSVVGEDGNFGARLFQVKPKGKKHQMETKELMLRHGDLMTMEGMFQKYYLHSIWPGDSEKYTDHELCRGERINLTWRTIVRHLDGSDECRGLACPLSNRGK